MNVYVFDGTFEGLLTAVYQGYYEDWKPEAIVSVDQYQQRLTDTTKMVFTDQVKAQKVLSAIGHKLGEDTMQMVLYAFLSEHEDRGTYIYRFLRFAFKVGSRAIEYLTNEAVTPMWACYRKVGREGHRMVGLIRFVELESGVLYSQYESDYNIIPILGEHFADRLKGQAWILHDMGREQGAVCDGQTWHMRPLTTPEVIQLHESEITFQQLWRTYFKHISIKERANPKLQRGHMPKKYWKYLVEMNPVDDAFTRKQLPKS